MNERPDPGRKGLFESEIATIRSRASDLTRRAEAASDPSVAIGALAELETVLEELCVADEQLHQQHEALALAQIQVDAERRRYADLFEHAPYAYIVTDPAGLILDANFPAVEMLGVRASFLTGKPFVNYVALTDRSVVRAHLLALNRSSRPGQFTDYVRMAPRNQPAFEALLHFAGIRSSDGTQLDTVRWSLSDMTQRAHVEIERYRMLVDAVEDYAIYLIDSDGAILSWNRGAERLFGYDEREILGKNIARLGSPESTSALSRAAWLEIAQSQGSVETAEWQVRSDGVKFFAEGVLSSFRFGTRTEFVQVLRDVTERHRSDAALLALKERLEGILESISDGFYAVDEHWRITYVNGKMAQTLGRNRDEMIGGSLWEVFPGNEDAKTAEAHRTAARARQPIEFETISPVVGGWIQVNIYPNSSGGLSVYFRDIAERKRIESDLEEARYSLERRVLERTVELAASNAHLEAEMAQRRLAEKGRRDLLRQIVITQEDERRRISRELHDQMGQHITAFALGLRTLREQHQTDPASQKLLGRLEEIAQTMGADIHRLAVDLRPTALDDLGLELALRGFVEGWSERTGIVAAMQTHGLVARLPAEIETMLYRVVQEAMNNACKYACARHVSVLLSQSDSRVRLVVEDDGIGFDVDAVLDENFSPPAREKLGLLGIRERATLAGGTFTIESAPGSGTTLFVDIPIVESV
jgi:PAS domain S-box-containing protein